MVAAGVICLLSPVRLVGRFHRVSPPPFIASTIEVRILESEFRRKLQPKEKLIERSGVEARMTLMELGCGPRMYTTDFARAIGEEGKLYAVDVWQEMIDRLKKNQNIKTSVTLKQK